MGEYQSEMVWSYVNIPQWPSASARHKCPLSHVHSGTWAGRRSLPPLQTETRTSLVRINVNEHNLNVLILVVIVGCEDELSFHHI